MQICDCFTRFSCISYRISGTASARIIVICDTMLAHIRHGTVSKMHTSCRICLGCVHHTVRHSFKPLVNRHVTAVFPLLRLVSAGEYEEQLNVSVAFSRHGNTAGGKCIKPHGATADERAKSLSIASFYLSIDRGAEKSYVTARDNSVPREKALSVTVVFHVCRPFQ